MAGYVYMLASRKNGTLYIGVTSNLEQRIHQKVRGKKAGGASGNWNLWKQ